MNTKNIIENSKVVSITWLGNDSNSVSRIKTSSSNNRILGKNVEENKVVGVLVQNLSIRVTKLDLVKVFRPIGQIHSIDMNVSGKRFPLGSASIKFENPKHAVKAYEKLNGTLLDGQRMKLMLLLEKQESTFYRTMHTTGKARKYYSHGVDMVCMTGYQRKFSRNKLVI